jgi:electron transfer flavoprotein alpha subunit
MAHILVIAEHRNGKLKKATLECVAASAASGNDTSVALLGKGVDSLAKELAQYGAKKIFVAQADALALYTSEAYCAAIVEIAKTQKPDVIMAAHTPTGRDLMPHVACKLEAGLASDCTFVTLTGGGVKAKRPVYAGKAIAEIEFVGSGIKCLTVRSNTFGLPKTPTPGAGEVMNITSSLASLKTKHIETVAATATRPDVTEAAIVVSGGRSLKNAENFKILEDLADTVGAAVGASRAAVDAGFRPHRDQVGQTGKVVSPSLYIACGISGAIQHLAGMRTSKTIVAINTDPEAPMFQVADYGIVGDLFTVVPLLTAEFKKIKEGS